MSAFRRVRAALSAASAITEPGYRAVLRAEHALPTFAAALLGRLSYGTVGLSLVLTLAEATGSLAAAGTALAAFSLTGAVLSPARAALVDRYGVRRVLCANGRLSRPTLAGGAGPKPPPDRMTGAGRIC